MRKKYPLSVLLLVTLLFACNSSDNGTPTEENFDVSRLLTEVTNKTIIPAIVEFNTQANIFNDLVAVYLNDSSEANLSSVRAQWIETALAYERTYNFHIGIVRARFLHQAIYNWPTVASAIEDFIANDEVTEQTVAAISPQIKALAGIEYLLFKGDLATTHKSFLDSDKRRDYLKYSVAFLTSQAIRLSDIWAADGENYASTFVTNDASGIDGSFNLLFNGLYNAVDTGKVTKIGKPAGLEKSPNTNPDIVQAPFSDLSLELLSESIEMVEEVFFSNSNTNISDYIFFILDDNGLNTDIATKINEVKLAIEAIPVPLEEAVDSNPTEVATLHAKLAELGVLISVDVRSVLSIIITSTDNDGD